MVPLVERLVATCGLVSLGNIPMMVENFDRHGWMEYGFGMAFLSQYTVPLQWDVSKVLQRTKISLFC